MINSIENIYSGGSCTDGVSSRGSCGGGHIWIPKFKYTKVTTEYDHDLADADIVVIRGSIAYPLIYLSTMTKQLNHTHRQ